MSKENPIKIQHYETTCLFRAEITRTRSTAVSIHLGDGKHWVTWKQSTLKVFTVSEVLHLKVLVQKNISLTIKLCKQDLKRPRLLSPC